MARASRATPRTRCRGAPSLGAQWKVWGQTIDAAGAVEVDNTVDVNGNGYIDYATNYTGGQFWLSGTHSWSLDGQPITGALTYYNVAARVQYVAGQAVAVNSNVFFDGTIDGCTDCQIAYTIANAELIWSSAFGTPAPADYPALLCGATTGELLRRLLHHHGDHLRWRGDGAADLGPDQDPLPLDPATTPTLDASRRCPTGGSSLLPADPELRAMTRACPGG